MDQKIGIVLSGGGVRAMAHIGLLQCFRDEGIKIDAIAGTSAGATIAAMFAYGYSSKEMLTFFKNTPLFKYSQYTFNKPGIVDSEKFIGAFKSIFPNDTFDDLKVPTYITATNLLTGNLEYFTKGELIRPLIASSSVPPFFSPMEINENLYADGGIINDFPVEPLQNNCSKIIGSFINPIDLITKKDIDTTLKLISRVYQIGLKTKDIAKFSSCNYVFKPNNLKKIGLLDTKFIDTAYNFGYEQAKNEIEKIQLVLQS
jgi:NTE family protein